MTSLDAVSATSSNPSMYSTQPTRQPSQTMTSDDFMHLLVVQLQNQDPSSPMDTGAMVQQTTMLSMMSSVKDIGTAVSSGLSLQQAAVASSMIGKSIDYYDKDGNKQSGTATGVQLTTSGPVMQVGNDEVTFSNIIGINQQAA